MNSIIYREKNGKSAFKYKFKKGNVPDKKIISEIAKYRIPPAWKKVEITLNKDLITNLAENTVVKFFGISASVLRSASALVDLQGNAKSSYSLKVDANGSIASMQLLAEANADGTTSSSVAFAADKFKVFNTIFNY